MPSSPPAHFHWLTPVMRWISSLSKLRSDFDTLRRAALGIVQARRKNPRTQVNQNTSSVVVCFVHSTHTIIIAVILGTRKLSQFSNDIYRLSKIN